MRILIAPDKFKGTLTAIEAAEAMAAGVRRVLPDAVLELCPMADGGEGTVATLCGAAASAGGAWPKLYTPRVTGPLPEMRVNAVFAMLDERTAVVEMAAASGLALVPENERAPLGSTTFGAGELIAIAVRAGARRVLVGLGGSAAMDGGLGCLQALGFTVLMRTGETPSPTEPLCGRDIADVLAVKHGRGEVTSGIELIALTDVLSPLTGRGGASQCFGPQKGATAAEITATDTALDDLAKRTGKDAEAIMPGAGAAGGMGFGLHAYAGARILPGAAAVADAVGLRDRLARADLCLTGEGLLDSSSLHGKVVGVVGEFCRTCGVPCVALVGSATPDFISPDYLAFYPTLPPGMPHSVKPGAARDLADLTERVARRRFIDSR